MSGENVYSHSAFNTPPPPCPGGCTPIEKPFVDSSATVYVIFGLKAIDRSKIVRERVIEKKVNYFDLEGRRKSMCSFVFLYKVA